PGGVLRPIVAIDDDVFLRQVASQDSIATLTQSQRHFEADFRFFHHRTYARFVIGRIASAFVGDTNAAEPYRESVAVGWFAGLADPPYHPPPIPTRPQFASSPAIAVFTSGELAIDKAMRRAETFDTAPSTTISTSLRAPSPSRAICSDRLARMLCSALLKPFRRGSAARAMRGTPTALPVAKIISVSDVEVSPSIVTALNVSV